MFTALTMVHRKESKLYDCLAPLLFLFMFLINLILVLLGFQEEPCGMQVSLEGLVVRTLINKI